MSKTTTTTTKKPRQRKVRFRLPGVIANESILLTLFDEKDPGKSYNAVQDEPVAIPAGDYYVAGSYTPTEDFRVLKGYAYTVTPFAVAASVSVAEGDADIDVPVGFGCFALVLDDPELTYCVRGHDGRMMVLNRMKQIDGRKVLFLDGQFDHPGLDLEVSCWTEKREFRIVNDPAFEGTAVKVGMAYAFSLNGVEEFPMAELTKKR